MGDACENEPQVKKATRESTEVKETLSDISQTTGDELAWPLLMAYPKHCEGKSHGRSFVASWYDRYSWVEYSQECDAIFSFPCRHFCPPLVIATLKRHLRRLGSVDGKKHTEKIAEFI